MLRTMAFGRTWLRKALVAEAAVRLLVPGLAFQSRPAMRAFRSPLPVQSTCLFSTTTESSVDAPAAIAPEELEIVCSDGTRLAYQHWQSPSPSKTSESSLFLCLHGWMDNCRSFHHVAPSLVSKVPNSNLIALDLPGHGRSSHKSLDAPPMVQADLAFYLSQAIHQLAKDDQKITLIGHSLGAGISSLYTAAFPEQVERLVLLDGAGFLPRNPRDTAHHLRDHVLKRQKYNAKPPRVFPSLDLAVKTRVRNAKRMPGNQSLSYPAAQELVQRATRPMPLEGTEDMGVQFQHDPRFAWPSIQYMTWPQVEGIFQTLGEHNQQKNAGIDIAILLARDGWPFPEDHLTRTLELLQSSFYRTLPGSHYFHADPETADAVVDAIVEFCTRDQED